jgi:hypothetical protein
MELHGGVTVEDEVGGDDHWQVPPGGPGHDELAEAELVQYGAPLVVMVRRVPRMYQHDCDHFI